MRNEKFKYIQAYSVLGLGRKPGLLATKQYKHINEYIFRYNYFWKIHSVCVIYYCQLNIWTQLP